MFGTPALVWNSELALFPWAIVDFILNQFLCLSNGVGNVNLTSQLDC